MKYYIKNVYDCYRVFLYRHLATHFEILQRDAISFPEREGSLSVFILDIKLQKHCLMPL